MTLLQFLNKLRKDGGDITRLKVRMRDAEGSTWRNGLKVNGLRGNRLSVAYGPHEDYQLMAGHSCLSCSVEAISVIPLSNKRLSAPRSNDTSLLVTISKYAGA